MNEFSVLKLRTTAEGDGVWRSREGILSGEMYGLYILEFTPVHQNISVDTLQMLLDPDLCDRPCPISYALHMVGSLQRSSTSVMELEVWTLSIPPL